MFDIGTRVLALWMEPSFTCVTANISLQGVGWHFARAKCLPVFEVRGECLPLRAVLRTCVVGVCFGWCTVFKLLKCQDGAAGVDRLNVDVLVVICTKELDIVCDAVHLSVCKLHFEQVFLLIVPTHFELGEVSMLWVSGANLEDLPDQV